MIRSPTKLLAGFRREPTNSSRLSHGLVTSLAALTALLTASVAAPAPTTNPQSETLSPLQQDRTAPLFRDVTGESGIDFQHHHFGTGEKYMPENMGSGVAAFDANNDGLLDLYFVQGAPWSEGQATSYSRGERTNRLFLQTNGTFRAAKTSGLEDPGYGMGVTVGDINRDGFQDVLVSNFGINRLFVGLGNAKFEDQTDRRLPKGPGNAATLWSTGTTFFDADGDGDLDLYVVNYLDFSLTNHKFCGSAARKLRSYCHPDIYNAQPDTFYRNRGDGTFEDATAIMGFASAPTGNPNSFASQSKGLGVFAGDLNGDGATDLYVANDSTRNLVFLTTGKRFTEDGLLTGLGYSGAGTPEASMGIAAGDVDGDGKLDLLLTHLDQETNTLYRNLGGGLFTDATVPSGLASPSLALVGFGTQLFDMDLDGDLDLFVGNGHIIDNIAEFDAERSYLQPPQLFENRGNGTYIEVSERLGLGKRKLAARGVVAADWDQDGDLDLVITQNNGPALMLRNELVGGRSVTVRLAANQGVPEGIGAEVRLVATGRGKESLEHPSQEDPDQTIATRWIHATSSYLSQPPRAVVVAIPGTGSGSVTQESYRIEVLWPSGLRSAHAVDLGKERSQLIAEEPGTASGKIGREPR